MAPEQELHERDERNRRRRPAADWGVAEDIFDRMPSRRFKRGRAESQEIVIRRADTGAEAEWVDEGPAVAEWEDTAPRRVPDVWIDDEPRQAVDTWAEEAPRRGAPRRSADSWAEVEPRRAGDSWGDDEPRRGSSRGVEVRVEPGSGRTVDSWVEEEPRNSPDERQVESWLDDEARPLVRGESRTIVLSRPELPLAPVDEPVSQSGRKTVVISGHPDRLPVARTPRPPRTAVERISVSPDRIAGYAVALGFLLVLIAVLTTGH